MKLEVTNKILKEPDYLNIISMLNEIEKDRIFCKHDIEHFISVARICCIMCAEKGLSVDADIIYSASLLHDIGRIVEYKTGNPHEIAGKYIAEKILLKTGCSEIFRKTVIDIISNHRTPDKEDLSLKKIFYLADKKSRCCFFCKAKDKCYWDDEKKNMNIEL